MKKNLLLAVLVVCALVAWMSYANKSSTSASVASPVKTIAVNAGTISAANATGKPSEPKSTSSLIVITPNDDPVASEELDAIRITVSPTTTFDEKLSTWNKLRDAGQLDQAIVELEKIAAANPTTPELFVALGHAYMVKSGTVSDIAQVGALGMKIDQAFTTALKLDPANWEAQYSKGVSLTYYPAFMNKQKDIIETFSNLIQQQEQSPPQPEFANTYLRLGDEYQKEGNTDFAAKTWQQGAQLFPDNANLRQRTTRVPAPQP
ncbi:MAG TPA: hypothetical protein VK737_08525 [Opitutales bacterium]|jgi:hypothetical protein|nr:hypothetical protein [Opitutales bacterium]